MFKATVVYIRRFRNEKTAGRNDITRIKWYTARGKRIGDREYSWFGSSEIVRLGGRTEWTLFDKRILKRPV